MNPYKEATIIRVQTLIKNYPHLNPLDDYYKIELAQCRKQIKDHKINPEEIFKPNIYHKNKLPPNAKMTYKQYLKARESQWHQLKTLRKHLYYINKRV
tara:strand:+ start:604 stop:897 length:294 start_codon:yes stop_codon:yes gene_type:complete